MFAPDTDYDPIPVAAGHLLAEVGIDADAVRETLADDLARRCPDREVLADDSPLAPRLGGRRRGDRELEGSERRMNGRGAGESSSGSRPFATHRHYSAIGERT